jgi:rhomboid-related protein 1/2/3
LNLDENIGYAAHFAGGVAGLLVGINILRNLEVTKAERIVWWVSILTYCFLMIVAIVWNLAWQDYFVQAKNRETV